MKSVWKKIAAFIGTVLLFLVLSYGFVPEVLKGKIVNQSDISGYVGMSHEMDQWNRLHPDDPTYWTDSMFGGMPTTAISTRNQGDYTQWIYNLLLTGKRPATYLFITLLGAFLLMLAFGVSWPLAIGGAIAVAFCSYNFQIIQVGHNTKMQAIAFMPWVLAALVYTYRSRDLRRILLGAALFGLALSMQIKANHQQITYYLAIMVLLYAVVEFVSAWKGGRLKGFFVASALLLVLGTAGIATNVNKLLPLAKYTPHTMRGGSELTKADGPSSSGGLDLDYATAWSYGWEELPNLMIPNYNGGASAQAVNPDKSETVKLLRRAGQRGAREAAKALPMYWGPQPFTAGPMYMGAVTVFLFVLGLCLCRRKEKWWLAAVSLIAVLMALGNHFMPFTALCFKILPLYNKFRTVSMALVILQVAMPLLGFITLDSILRRPIEKQSLLRGLGISFALTGGFCLPVWLFPGIAGNFEGPADAGMQDVLLDALVVDRVMLLRSDAILSFVLILCSAALIYWACTTQGKGTIAAAGICILIAVNMFATGKRYLNSDHFVTPKDFNKPFAQRMADKIILEDKDPQYRVLDLTVNVFNSSVPSYHHKNVGGYSPAKLSRYQDLIERHLSNEITGLQKALMEDFDSWDDYMARSAPVLNALNTRYIILDGGYPPLENDNALGDAWFVDGFTPAATPEEEISLIGSCDLARTAVLSLEEIESLPSSMMTASEEDSIGMVSYAPNELHYEYTSASDRLAVFSEISYPGWKATVDGEPLDLLRADWTLRAALLPAGRHSVVMRFDPDSYRTGAAVSRVSSILLLLLLSVGIAGIKFAKKPLSGGVFENN